ncbi:MAG: hypothetical protein KF855_07255 [Acidobacteria bacterium]|nr:hypothetical protein [Acidobacteriota bacterium]
MKRIKVLHLTSTPKGLGGAEKLLIDMADKYDPDLFDVSYCNIFSEDPVNGIFERSLRSKGVNVHSFSGKSIFSLPSLILRLRKLIVQNNIDILHSHLLHATIIGAAVASTIPSLKVAVTKHYTEDLVSDRKLLFFSINLQQNKLIVSWPSQISYAQS